MRGDLHSCCGGEAFPRSLPARMAARTSHGIHVAQIAALQMGFGVAELPRAAKRPNAAKKRGLISTLSHLHATEGVCRERRSTSAVDLASREAPALSGSRDAEFLSRIRRKHLDQTMSNAAKARIMAHSSTARLQDTHGRRGRIACTRGGRLFSRKKRIER